MPDVGSVIGARLLGELEKAEEKLDEELHKMDRLDEDDLDTLRKKRLAELKAQREKAREWRAKGHGEYTELADQKQFFEVAKASERVVAHFYRPSTIRCDVLDKHFKVLSKKHMETRFVKLHAEKMPFLAERLHISVLPSVVLIRNGKTEHTIIGFDEMGGVDDFPTETLEDVLRMHGVVNE